MKKLAIVLAVGAAALLGGTAANADNSAKAEAATVGTSQSTDFSSRHRGYRHARPYYRSYRSYAPRRGYYAPRTYYAPRSYYAQPYYGGGGYGYGGPSISFGFGGGRW